MKRSPPRHTHLQPTGERNSKKDLWGSPGFMFFFEMKPETCLKFSLHLSLCERKILYKKDHKGGSSEPPKVSPSRLLLVLLLSQLRRQLRPEATAVFCALRRIFLVPSKATNESQSLRDKAHFFSTHQTSHCHVAWGQNTFLTSKRVYPLVYLRMALSSAGIDYRS